MKTIHKVITFAGLLLCTSGLYAADISAPRIIGSSTTWTADNVYFLEEYTFVVTPEGAAEPTVLTIEPGTVVKGRVSTGANAAALIITRGAKIHAEGTSTNPIIFTSELDDLNGNLGPDDFALWGGVLVLGKAAISSRADGEIVAAPVEDQIEGVEVTGEEIEFATFGGTDDDDDSGVLRYISIRHGGAVVGGDNEINGLTLGGVGRNTLIEFVEVFANKDDGIEWFGGTVSIRYAVVAFSYDDSFDYDQGWRGNGQYWLTIGKDTGEDRMDKGGEHDGATAPVDATPLSDTTVFNATYIGIGNSLQPDGTTPGRSNTAFNIRDNASARYKNSVFMDFAKMIDIENDNETRFNAGDIEFSNNVWWSHIAGNNSAAGFNARPDGNVDPTIFWTDAARDNVIADPMLAGVSRAAAGGFDPRPAAGSPALTGPFATVPNSWFEQTNYKGAFSPDYNWLIGWTKLSTEGYLAPNPSYVFTEQYGWVYTYTGSLGVGDWIWIVDLGRFAYMGSVGPSGSWSFIVN